MRPQRRTPRAALVAALLLPIGAPAALALATDDPLPTATAGASGPPVLVAEQVSTARGIVPFGWSDTAAAMATTAPTTPAPTEPDPAATTNAPAGTGTTATTATSPPLPDDPRVVWAFGRTRAASAIEGTTQSPPSDHTPSTAVLLEGTLASSTTPTAWRRGAAPLDAAGRPLADGTWNPADPTATTPVATPTTPSPSLHAGAATPNGAAALLVRIAPGGGTPARDAVLARTTDGRFRELPAPPTELVDPAPNAFTGAGQSTVPLAAFDAPLDTAHPDRGRTGLLLAPSGADGVLRWDGATWTEEPWQAAGGAATGSHTAVALAATAAGDAVALFPGDPTGSSADRVELARRDGAAHAFRAVPLAGSRLLGGALPSQVRSITPVAAPGQPLTISPHHWWVDLTITRADGVEVSATVHLRPPAPGATPTTPATTPTPTPDPSATTPAPTATPDPATTPAPTSDPAATPTPAPTTDPTGSTPTTPGTAAATGAWCTPVLADGACPRPLGFAFATGRGYTSAAFDATTTAGIDYGERAISSPVIRGDRDATPASTTPATQPAPTTSSQAPEASASGGFLEFVDGAFALRSGVGDDGTGGTQAAVFGPRGFAVVGGSRTIGRTMPASAATNDSLATTPPGTLEALSDIAIAPEDTPAGDAGAIEVSPLAGFRRQRGSGDWNYVSSRSFSIYSGDSVRPVTAIAWPTPDRVYVLGRDGLLVEMPASSLGENPFESSGPVKPLEVDVGDRDLLDIAATPDDAWAVGLHGAAMHRTASGWSPVTLAGDLRDANLLGVAYAAGQAFVASDHGLLAATPNGQLVLDQQLAALMRADGRPVAAHAVAGLHDGTIVVDARYVRQPGGQWSRLPSPAEGDVVALGIWRTDGATAPTSPTDPTSTTAADTSPVPSTTPAVLGTLRVVASIADVGRPMVGPITEVSNGPKSDPTEIQGAAMVQDGRVAVLGPDGWVDRMRVPLQRSIGRDLSAWSPPVGAIAVDPRGNGWVAGGIGTYLDFNTGNFANAPQSFEAPLGNPGIDQRAPEDRPVPAPGSASTIGAGDAPNGLDPDIDPDATPGIPRVLIGGHPACLDDCAGRGDQGVAPDATLDDALTTAERLGDAAASTSPDGLVVIGGGRATADQPLTPAGADRYLQLLRSHPSVPVIAAIGTGDATTDASREAFAGVARSLYADRLAATIDDPDAPIVAQTDTAAPLTQPGSNTVAYAITLHAAAGVPDSEVVVVDNAGGHLNGGAEGPQSRWLARTLQAAEDAERTTVVVGAARLDASSRAADDRDTELAILGRFGADAYVATDGADDPADRWFGAHSASSGTDTTHGGKVALYRTAALGHEAPFASQIVVSTRDDEGRDIAAGTATPALLGLTVSTSSSFDAAISPVFQHLLTGTIWEQAGRADYISIPGVGRSGTGFMAPESTTHIDFNDIPEVPGSTPTETTPEATGPLVETRSSSYVDATPIPCRLWVSDEVCRGRIAIDATYEVSDPSVAVFVRARPRSGANGPPTIVTDEHGDPVVDPGSAVLCPLRPGTTTVTVRVAGAAASYPLRVLDGPSDGSVANGKAPCAFLWRSEHQADEKPAATTPAAPPVPAPQPQPAPQPPHRGPTQPIEPAPRPFQPLLAAPIAFAPQRMVAGAAPPVAPNPKPANPAPPAPPQGISSQQVPVHQGAVQVQTGSVQQNIAVTQEERRTEVAREGAEHQATIYEPQPTSPVPYIAGGTLAILVAIAGRTAGRRRRLARAAARRWLG